MVCRPVRGSASTEKPPRPRVSIEARRHEFVTSSEGQENEHFYIIGVIVVVVVVAGYLGIHI
jgi:hypothetical protein